MSTKPKYSKSQGRSAKAKQEPQQAKALAKAHKKANQAKAKKGANQPTDPICEFTSKEIKSNETSYMRMKLNEPEIIFNSYTLPRLKVVPELDPSELDPSELDQYGLEAEISLSKIRLETIYVVYRGLCDLKDTIHDSNLNENPAQVSVKGNGDGKYTLGLGPRYALTADFSELKNIKKMKRDDLSILAKLDQAMLTTIGFLEKVINTYKSEVNNYGQNEIYKTVIDVLNSFIVCSSGKEYLDVGQLYAVVEHNEEIIKDANAFWNEYSVNYRVNKVKADLAENPGAIPGAIPEDIFEDYFKDTVQDGKLLDISKIPKRPFYETYDSAAAPIAGRYFNTYTQATIPVSDRATVNRSTYSNPGSLPFLYDNNNVLYLCFFYNYCLNPTSVEENIGGLDVNAALGEEIKPDYVKFMCAIIPFIKNQNLETFSYLLFDLMLYACINDVYAKLENFYYNNIAKFKEYIIIDQYEYDLISSVYYYHKKSDKQNLITTNLDALCHDNQDSVVYRKLMMYNFIKKNYIGDIEKEIVDTFGPSHSQYNMDTDETNLSINFSEGEKIYFKILLDNTWKKTENKLINRLYKTNCYVFPVEIKNDQGSCNQLVLISMKDTLPPPHGEQPHVRRPAYSYFYDLFDEPNNTYNIITKQIVPHFSRCCCDLSISDNLTLTRVNVPKMTRNTSIFNVTPITLNDAASASLDPHIEYLEVPVTIGFGKTDQGGDVDSRTTKRARITVGSEEAADVGDGSVVAVAPPSYPYELVFYGYDGPNWSEYIGDKPALKYYYNLTGFKNKYKHQISFLDSITNGTNFYYILLELKDVNYSKTQLLQSDATIFINSYDEIISDFTDSNNTRYTNFKSYIQLYNGYLHQKNEKFVTFKDAYERIHSQMNKAVNLTTGFKTFVELLKSNFAKLIDAVMGLILEIKTIEVQTAPDMIDKWLIPFITKLVIPFIDKTVTFEGGNRNECQNVCANMHIPIHSLLGYLGFVPLISEDGGMIFMAINEDKELDQVWNELGMIPIDLNINPLGEPKKADIVIKTNAYSEDASASASDDDDDVIISENAASAAVSQDEYVTFHQKAPFSAAAAALYNYNNNSAAVSQDEGWDKNEEEDDASASDTEGDDAGGEHKQKFSSVAVIHDDDVSAYDAVSVNKQNKDNNFLNSKRKHDDDEQSQQNPNSTKSNFSIVNSRGGKNPKRSGRLTRKKTKNKKQKNKTKKKNDKKRKNKTKKKLSRNKNKRIIRRTRRKH